MLDIGRAVENAQWLLLLQKQQCLVLERTGFGIKTYETAHSHSLPLSFFCIDSRNTRMSKHVKTCQKMSLVEVVCDVTVIFGPVPSLEVFRQHFGMEGPMQLFPVCHIAIPST